MKMRRSIAITIAIAMAVPLAAVVGLWALQWTAPAQLSPMVRVRFASSSAVLAFEDEGCAGTLEVEDASPHVWRESGSGANSGENALWVERIEDCGFDRAISPAARIGGGFVDLDYTLVLDSDGSLAACYCRYRAKFVLSKPVADSDHVTVAGRPAIWGKRAEPETETETRD